MEESHVIGDVLHNLALCGRLRPPWSSLLPGLFISWEGSSWDQVLSDDTSFAGVESVEGSGFVDASKALQIASFLERCLWFVSRSWIVFAFRVVHSTGEYLVARRPRDEGQGRT